MCDVGEVHATPRYVIMFSSLRYILVLWGDGKGNGDGNGNSRAPFTVPPLSRLVISSISVALLLYLS